MIVLLLFYIVVTVSFKNITCYNLNDAPQLFNDFIKVYDKKYNSDEDKKMRYQIFLKNLEKINVLNRSSKHANFDVNQFADLTLEEFLTQYTGYKRSTDACTNVTQTQEHAKFIQMPDEFDWRTKKVVTRVKNQGICGSCWAFSVIGNVESINAIKTGDLKELSEQQLVDCDLSDKGCGGGYPNRALMYLKNKGAMSAESYPYKDDECICTYDSGKIAVNVADCISINVKEDKLAEQLYKIGPLSIAVDGSYILAFYKKGIVTEGECRYGNLNHAALLVGYGVEGGVPYWLVKNSWGETWGEEGYFRIHRGVNCLGVVNYPPHSAVI